MHAHGSQWFYTLKNKLKYKYKTIETYARAFLPLNISAIGSVNKHLQKVLKESWIQATPLNLQLQRGSKQNYKIGKHFYDSMY